MFLFGKNLENLKIFWDILACFKGICKGIAGSDQIGFIKDAVG